MYSNSWFDTRHFTLFQQLIWYQKFYVIPTADLIPDILRYSNSWFDTRHFKQLHQIDQLFRVEEKGQICWIIIACHCNWCFDCTISTTKKKTNSSNYLYFFPRLKCHLVNRTLYRNGTGHGIAGAVFIPWPNWANYCDMVGIGRGYGK